jgi:hypothetical protein
VAVLKPVIVPSLVPMLKAIVLTPELVNAPMAAKIENRTIDP